MGSLVLHFFWVFCTYASQYGWRIYIYTSKVYSLNTVLPFKLGVSELQYRIRVESCRLWLWLYVSVIQHSALHIWEALCDALTEGIAPMWSIPSFGGWFGKSFTSAVSHLDISAASGSMNLLGRRRKVYLLSLCPFSLSNPNCFHGRASCTCCQRKQGIFLPWGHSPLNIKSL